MRWRRSEEDRGRRAGVGRSEGVRRREGVRSRERTQQGRGEGKREME
jgi:hypothetical protein